MLFRSWSEGTSGEFYEKWFGRARSMTALTWPLEDEGEADVDVFSGGQPPQTRGDWMLVGGTCRAGCLLLEGTLAHESLAER